MNQRRCFCISLLVFIFYGLTINTGDGEYVDKSTSRRLQRIENEHGGLGVHGGRSINKLIHVLINKSGVEIRRNHTIEYDVSNDVNSTTRENIHPKLGTFSNQSISYNTNGMQKVEKTHKHIIALFKAKKKNRRHMRRKKTSNTYAPKRTPTSNLGTLHNGNDTNHVMPKSPRTESCPASVLVRRNFPSEREIIGLPEYVNNPGPINPFMAMPQMNSFGAPMVPSQSAPIPMPFNTFPMNTFPTNVASSDGIASQVISDLTRAIDRQQMSGELQQVTNTLASTMLNTMVLTGHHRDYGDHNHIGYVHDDVVHVPYGNMHNDFQSGEHFYNDVHNVNMPRKIIHEEHIYHHYDTPSRVEQIDNPSYQSYQPDHDHYQSHSDNQNMDRPTTHHYDDDQFHSDEDDINGIHHTHHENLHHRVPFHHRGNHYYHDREHNGRHAHFYDSEHGGHDDYDGYDGENADEEDHHRIHMPEQRLNANDLAIAMAHMQDGNENVYVQIAKDMASEIKHELNNKTSKGGKKKQKKENNKQHTTIILEILKELRKKKKVDNGSETTPGPLPTPWPQPPISKPLVFPPSPIPIIPGQKPYPVPGKLPLSTARLSQQQQQATTDATDQQMQQQQQATGKEVLQPSNRYKDVSASSSIGEEKDINKLSIPDGAKTSVIQKKVNSGIKVPFMTKKKHKPRKDVSKQRKKATNLNGVGSFTNKGNNQVTESSISQQDKPNTYNADSIRPGRVNHIRPTANQEKTRHKNKKVNNDITQVPQETVNTVAKNGNYDVGESSPFRKENNNKVGRNPSLELHVPGSDGDNPGTNTVTKKKHEPRKGKTEEARKQEKKPTNLNGEMAFANKGDDQVTENSDKPNTYNANITPLASINDISPTTNQEATGHENKDVNADSTPFGSVNDISPATNREATGHENKDANDDYKQALQETLNTIAKSSNYDVGKSSRVEEENNNKVERNPSLELYVPGGDGDSPKTDIITLPEPPEVSKASSVEEEDNNKVERNPALELYVAGGDDDSPKTNVVNLPDVNSISHLNNEGANVLNDENAKAPDDDQLSSIIKNVDNMVDTDDGDSGINKDNAAPIEQSEDGGKGRGGDAPSQIIVPKGDLGNPETNVVNLANKARNNKKKAKEHDKETMEEIELLKDLNSLKTKTERASTKSKSHNPKKHKSNIQRAHMKNVGEVFIGKDAYDRILKKAVAKAADRLSFGLRKRNLLKSSFLPH